MGNKAATQEKPVAETTAVVKGQPLGAHELSKTQAAKVKGLPTVSARIRYLLDEGLTRSEISRAIPNASGGKLRYQHVNNVMRQTLAKTK